METLSLFKMWVNFTFDETNPLTETTYQEMLDYQKKGINEKYCDLEVVFTGNHEVVFTDNHKETLGYHYCFQQTSKKVKPEYWYPYVQRKLKKNEETRWFIYGETEDKEYRGMKCSNWRVLGWENSIEEAMEFVDNIVRKTSLVNIVDKLNDLFQKEGSGIHVEII